MTNFNTIEQIQQIIADMLLAMDIVGARVEYEESITRGLVFNISLPDAFVLIGRHGNVLHALETIVQSIVSRKLAQEPPVYFKIDVDDYRIKREWFLKETVRQAVAHIKKTGRAVRLEPMPAFERRFVHAYIQENFTEVFSESQGQEPYRRIMLSVGK